MSPARSLTGRLILGNALLLPLFLGVSGWFLERSHLRSLEAAQEQTLQLRALALMAQVEFADGISLAQEQIESRYQQVGSGLYARITDAAGAVLWQSPSAVTLADNSGDTPAAALRPGERRLRRREEHYELSWQVLWQIEPGQEEPLQFTVMETAETLDAQIAAYRRGLLLWLAGSVVLLLACQAALLAWALAPLRRLAGEVAAIESGRAEQLAGQYPREVQPLTDNLNTLLEGERQRRERVRNTLGDLAHSLKTPLAILRGADPAQTGYAELVREQLARMQSIVDYQLQRAAGGDHRLLRLIPVAPALRRLRDSLLKVYADKSLRITLEIAPECRFRGDERDLLEVAGNVLDNACKYSRQSILIAATGGAPGPLELRVQDDGPGIPPAARDDILQRGARLDTHSDGQGLGLAVAADIVASYGGSLAIEDAPGGGTSVRLRFP